MILQLVVGHCVLRIKMAHLREHDYEVTGSISAGNVFPSSSTDVLWKQIVSHSGSLWEPTGTLALLWGPYYPLRRTITGVRDDISLLFCPFLFLLSFITLFIFTSILSFLCLILPSILFVSLSLFGVFVSFFPISVFACVLNIPSLLSVNVSL